MLSCFERVNVCFETDRHIRYWFIHTVEGKHTVEGHDQQGTHPHTYQTQERHAHSHVEKCVCVRLGGLKWPPGRQRHSREQQQYGCLARLSDATVDMDAATMEIIIQAPRRGGNSLVNIFSGPFCTQRYEHRIKHPLGEGSSTFLHTIIHTHTHTHMRVDVCALRHRSVAYCDGALRVQHTHTRTHTDPAHHPHTRVPAGRVARTEFPRRSADERPKETQHDRRDTWKSRAIRLPNASTKIVLQFGSALAKVA